ncbi:hypothetical protein LBBP_03977 [Leptospira borgpetersenii serovar Ballum]|uniref:Uncharacterized protein n=1 Tax=Leptospira borgpetersenii serovar Ballum TaxID=280505 RepID=A0A0S2IWW4_LEPBO|nr:hypothetical protein LBBP_03977 [Leptospira borgpetersenii serovar Ballum]
MTNEISFPRTKEGLIFCCLQKLSVATKNRRQYLFYKD